MAQNLAHLLRSHGLSTWLDVENLSGEQQGAEKIELSDTWAGEVPWADLVLAAMNIAKEIKPFPKK